MELTFTIKTEDKEYKAVLREPLFNEYRMATMALNGVTGNIDKLAAGSSLVQYCWVSGDEDLKKGDETKDPLIAKAYTTLCFDVYNEVFTGYESEVKKN